MDTLGLLLVGLAMAVGLVGVVVPLLPGTALVLAAGVAWALLSEGDGRWLVVALMTALFVAGLVLKYALPGRRLSGRLPRRTLLYGGLGALVGFFVLPPLGLLLGGVAGAYLGEATRVGHGPEARAATVQVLRAVGLGILAELIAGVLMVAVWLVGVAVT
jgi:uncharacterized protein YqgC (DUF456 family)